MTWLLGVVGAVGVGGAVTLAIYIARMAATNRADLLKLVAATQTIGERDRDQAVRIERYKGLENANNQLKDEITRANAAINKARLLIMAGRSGERGGVDGINDALSVLSEMSAPAATTATENGDDASAVHGSPSS